MPFWEIQVYEHSSPGEAAKSKDYLRKGEVSGNCLVVLDGIEEFPKPSYIIKHPSIKSIYFQAPDEDSAQDFFKDKLKKFSK